MTNKEKFLRTFDVLCASPEILTKVLNMKTDKKRKHHIKKVIVAIAVLLVLIYIYHLQR